MRRILKEQCLLVREDGHGFLEANAMFLLVQLILALILCESDIIHNYNVNTYTRLVKSTIEGTGNWAFRPRALGLCGGVQMNST